MLRGLVCCAFVLVGALSVRGEEPAPKLESLEERSSYALGLDAGMRLKSLGVTLDPKVFLRGLIDGLNNNKPLLAEEELQKAQAELQQQVAERETKKFENLAASNLKEGEAFLEKNKKQPDVVTTKSGLQYKVLKEGKGAKPKKTDVVTTHYAGKLLDGTEFDSSYKRKEPASFPLDRVIAGWTEALQLMTVGSKYQLFVPAQLAYGAEGRPPVIGPNATLVFEVELLEIGEPKRKGLGIEVEQLPEN